MLFVNRLNSAILVATALLPREGGEGGMGREGGQGTHDVPIHVCNELHFNSHVTSLGGESLPGPFHLVEKVMFLYFD